jgi:hypothetical protein
MHKRIAEHYWSRHRNAWAGADNYALAYMATHLGRVGAWAQLQELLLDPSFVRALSDFLNEALADAYDWAAECLAQMSEGSRRR